ncbi:NUDIX hydrolase [Rothia sp. ZJ932]|uniref:NUDIX domain-containing protein n=1 Tax=Rothia sp. ZJ932 TaxID=2810516 RepID=UPI001967981C|nr:NUDIX hydrolase [Rothia sp. ZJ932]QRZ60998.1 NUDIX hydrolase [Rothia sp. ZJ932]
MQQKLHADTGTAPRIDARAEVINQTQLADVVNPRFVRSHETKFEGYIWDVVREDFSLTEDGEALGRDFITHPGAVCISVLNDKNQILLINQYRQPVGMNLWEIPAGMLDVEGEDPLTAAKRELAEETDLQAEQWDLLMEYHNSPGCSAEANRMYLARGISEISATEKTQREGEEAEIIMRWFDLEEAVGAVLNARLHSPSANQAILATYAALQGGIVGAKPVDAPWPAHPYLRDGNYRGSLS